MWMRQLIRIYNVCMSFCKWFWLHLQLRIMDVPEIKNGIFHFRNLGVKGVSRGHWYIQYSIFRTCFFFFFCFVLLLYPFIPEFLNWTLAPLNLVRATFPNRGLSQKLKLNGKHGRPWWDGSSWAVASGSTLFKICLVQMAERIWVKTFSK